MCLGDIPQGISKCICKQSHIRSTSDPKDFNPWAHSPLLRQHVVPIPGGHRIVAELSVNTQRSFSPELLDSNDSPVSVSRVAETTRCLPTPPCLAGPKDLGDSACISFVLEHFHGGLQAPGLRTRVVQRSIWESSLDTYTLFLSLHVLLFLMVSCGCSQLSSLGAFSFSILVNKNSK